jgi:2'-5' RNA ligase
MDEKIRCFIAIELSQEIRQVLGRIEDELQGTISGVKWVKPDNIHLTLKFIGSIEEEKVDKIKEILNQIAQDIIPFKIELSSAGAFPSPGRPRVIWIGIEEGKEESSRLANLVEEKIAPLGIEKESRAFHPHLTLARVKFLKDKSSVENAFAHLKVPQTEMTALKVTLFQSTLAREGAIYTVLHEADFKNTA